NYSARVSISSLLISARTFRRHLNLICKRFDCISLDDALEAVEGRRELKRDAVVLTFDDGYQDFYYVAYPILRYYNLPAVIFVPTALIGRSTFLTHDQIYFLIMEMTRRNRSVAALLEKLNLTAHLSTVIRSLRLGNADYYSALRALIELSYERSKLLIKAMKEELKFSDTDFPREYNLLTWPMLSEMALGGITVGAHTRKHVLLTQESLEVAEREIRVSKTELEQLLGKPALHFAYPDGRYSRQIADIVKNVGFRSDCTMVEQRSAI